MGNSLLCVFAVNSNVLGARGAPYVRILKIFPCNSVCFRGHYWFFLLTFYFLLLTSTWIPWP